MKNLKSDLLLILSIIIVLLSANNAKAEDQHPTNPKITKVFKSRFTFNAKEAKTLDSLKKAGYKADEIHVLENCTKVTFIKTR